jgi:4-hydroxy-4-methyl-2-oxoglutarate aldolase
MSGVVITSTPPLDANLAARLGAHGVATVHEAMGRTGLLGHDLRPLIADRAIAGRAVPVLCWPGDNLMIHAAVEQCSEGDVLVVTTVSPNLDGLFGELFATALQARGVRGLVTTTGVRDTADLRRMGFPVWSRAVSAQGSVKATGGSVNAPIVIAGTVINPSDIVVADDDGVVIVPRLDASTVAAAADERVAKEARARKQYQAGDLSLDVNGLRATLRSAEVEYRPYF